MNSRRVAITGVGLVTPLGIGVEEVWKGLLEKKNAVTRIDAFDPSGFESKVAGQIENLKTTQYVPKTYRKSVKIMARDIEIAVSASHQAIKDANLATKCMVDRGESEGMSGVDPDRLGVNIGAGLICADLNELASALSTSVDEKGNFDIHQWGKEGMTNLTPLWLLKFLPNMLSCHVTIVHDAQSTSNTITCSEASSHLAIGESFRTITRGDADVCICGGAESKLNPMGLLRQQLLQRLSKKDDGEATDACRPFDSQHDGTVISEGGGLLVLEEMEHAKTRGAKIYGELVGFGAGTNTRNWSQPHPEGQGLSTAIRRALRDANLSAEDVDMIGTFGTGIPGYDISEANGLRTVLGERIGKIPALAIKGAVGNNGAGSGAIDMGIAALCMYNNTIVPAANVNEVNPQCGLNVITGDPIDAKIKTVLSVGYSLSGGQNAALIFRRMES